MEKIVAPNAQELATVILRFTVKDSGCSWYTVGTMLYIRNSEGKVVAEIRRSW